VLQPFFSVTNVSLDVSWAIFFWLGSVEFNQFTVPFQLLKVTLPLTFVLGCPNERIFRIFFSSSPIMYRPNQGQDYSNGARRRDPFIGYRGQRTFGVGGPALLTPALLTDKSVSSVNQRSESVSFLGSPSVDGRCELAPLDNKGPLAFVSPSSSGYSPPNQVVLYPLTLSRLIARWSLGPTINSIPVVRLIVNMVF
jgi:hypothetical protein